MATRERSIVEVETDLNQENSLQARKFNQMIARRVAMMRDFELNRDASVVGINVDTKTVVLEEQPKGDRVYCLRFIRWYGNSIHVDTIYPFGIDN